MSEVSMHGKPLHEKVKVLPDSKDPETEAMLDGIVNTLLNLQDPNKQIASTMTNLSHLMQFMDMDDPHIENVITWMKNTLKNENGEPMFSSVIEARKFLQDLKDRKRLKEQLKWRVPSVYERLAAEPNNKKINPMLLRGLSNSSSNNFSRLYA